jgi:prophage maintenance system killer protein
VTVGYLSVEQVRALHADQLRVYGGATGLRDKGALESVAVEALAIWFRQRLRATE